MRHSPGFNRPLPAEMPFRVGETPTGDRADHFWAWAFGNLASNATRGVLAEFIVARALGVELGVRDEWVNHDVVLADGTTVEVKSSAYVQTWKQRGPSKIVFGGLKARRWTVEDGYVGEPEYRSDVYVFALHTARTLDGYDPMDLSLWRFWVLPRAVVAGPSRGRTCCRRRERSDRHGSCLMNGQRVGARRRAPAARDRPRRCYELPTLFAPRSQFRG